MFGSGSIHPRFTAPSDGSARPPQWNPPLSGQAHKGGALRAAVETQGEFEMTKITAVLAMMCALSAYVSYPSSTVPGGASPLAMSMQESRSLPIEAYDAV